MKELEIDIETKSDRDITKCGVYAYADSPYFDILLFSYSIDSGEVQSVDVANNEKIPDDILKALTDEAIIKRAFNVNFERVCLSRYLAKNYPSFFQSYSIKEDTVGNHLSSVNWHCTMIHCRTLGLPSSLAEVGKVLNLEQQKMAEGKALIKYFCVPYDTIDGVPQFHSPADAPEKWKIFKEYNKRDVEAELAIDCKLSKYPVPDFIWEEFYLDQEINDRGIAVDMELVETEARETVKHGYYDKVEMFYDDVPDTLSQLIRTAFVPRKGYKFIVADFSSIEMRCSAYYAGEQWVLDTFARGGDIYCETASQMFGVPVEKHGVNSHLRQRGKQAALSCSYGGSVGALKAMGAIENGMKEEELKPMVDKWRAANPNIVHFWYAVDDAAKQAVKEKTKTETHGISFIFKSNMLFIELPSGRRLAYVKPKIGENQFGGESITYMGIGASKKWERLETFGGKLVENIIQAIARDILCYAMRTLSHCFIVAHVHDELIIECDKRMSLKAVCEQMGRTPPWAKGLLLRADGYECEFYKKD